MKSYGRQWMVCAVTAALLAMQTTGCGQKRVGELIETTIEHEENEVEESGSSAAVDQEVTVKLGEGGEKSIRFQEEDWETDWNADQVTGLVLTDAGITVAGSGADVSGNVATIRKGGTYVVSGLLADGQIRVEAGDNEIVHLVLNGVELSSKETAPIYGADKTKVVLTLETGTRNVICDGKDYVYEMEGEDEPDAPIFIKGDLTINGSGTLEVQGNYQSGIRSKGELKVMSGTIMIDAQDDGLKGKDCIIIRDGELTIRAVKDGMKSNQDEDPERGFIWIENGTIRIAAQDDGIQAETALIIRDGDIDITESQEGLAGKTVDILGGVIRAVTQDDGINSAASVNTEREKMMDQDGVYTRIAGGEVWLNARADGIDSNGDFYMEGGTLYLTGPDSGADGIFDYNGHAEISGGVVFAAGSSSMMQTFGEDSTQPFLVVYYSEMQNEGTEIRLTDADGRELGSYTPERGFEAVIVSSPELQEGNTYHITTGENTVELTVDGLETISGEAPSKGGRSGMGHPGGEGRPDGTDRPEGMERPDGESLPDGESRSGRKGRPEGIERPDGESFPDGESRPDRKGRPEGMERPDGESLPDGESRSDRKGRPEGMERSDGESLPDGESRSEG